MLNIKKLFHLTLIVLFLWPTYITLKISNLPGLSLDRLMLFFMLAIFIIGIMVNRGYIQNLKSHSKIVLLFLITFTWYIFSSFIAADNTIQSIYGSVNWFLSGPFLTLFVLMIYKNEKDINRLIKIILIAIIIINVLGFIEVFYADKLFKNFLISQNEYTEYTMKLNIRNNFVRIQSVFSNPLVYAQFLVVSLPLFFYILSNQTNKVIKIFLLLNIVLSYFLIYITGSRAGLLLGLAAPILLYHLKLYKILIYRFISKSIIFMIVPLILFNTYDVLRDSFINVDSLHEQNVRGELDENTVSTLARVLQLKLGIEAIVRQPIMGYGFGEATKLVAPLKAIDNYYLTILLSTGIVGLGMFIYFILIILKQGFKNIKLHNDKKSIYLLTSFILTLLYYIILSIDKGNNLLFLIAAMILMKTKLLNEYNLRDNNQCKI